MGRTQGEIELIIGNWLFCRTSDLKVTFYYPYSKIGKNRVFQPYLGISTPSGEVLLHGRKALWSLLDSIHPDDPLPRNPVNNDLKQAIVGHRTMQGLLSDADAWPYLRIQIRDGEGQDQNGIATTGIFALSVSPSASETEVTPNLLLLEAEHKNSYSIPLTIHTRTKMKTIPALVITLEGEEDFKVVVTDSIGGNHLVFSVIEKHGSGFRPQRHEVFPVSNMSKVGKNIGERLNILSTISKQNVIFPPMKSLPNRMRFTERDDLEFRRFQNLNCLSSLGDS